MCDEPRFKKGERVQGRSSGGWATILDGPVTYVGLKQHHYLVRYDDSEHGTLIIHAKGLRPAERWEPCPGTHRNRGGFGAQYSDMERRHD